MTDLETAFRKIVTDVVREELHAAFTHFFQQRAPDAGRRYVSAAQAGPSLALAKASSVFGFGKTGFLRTSEFEIVFGRAVQVTAMCHSFGSSHSGITDVSGVACRTWTPELRGVTMS